MQARNHKLGLLYAQEHIGIHTAFTAFFYSAQSIRCIRIFYSRIPIFSHSLDIEILLAPLWEPFVALRGDFYLGREEPLHPWEFGWLLEQDTSALTPVVHGFLKFGPMRFL